MAGGQTSRGIATKGESGCSHGCTRWTRRGDSACGRAPGDSSGFISRRRATGGGEDMTMEVTWPLSHMETGLAHAEVQHSCAGGGGIVGGRIPDRNGGEGGTATDVDTIIGGRTLPQQGR